MRKTKEDMLITREKILQAGKKLVIIAEDVERFIGTLKIKKSFFAR